MLSKHSAGLLLALPALAAAQLSMWDPCGGMDFTGPTICPAGSTCVYLNPYDSQCQPVTSSITSTTQSSSTTLTTSTKSTTRPHSHPHPPPPPSTKPTPSTTAPTRTVAEAASATGPGTTLQSGWYWIRAVESPNFHKYLQTSPEYASGTAIMGDYTKAGQFNIIDGQLVELVDPASGAVLYASVAQQANASETTLPLAFGSAKNTYGSFAWQGDAVTWTVSSISRPNPAAWYVCTAQQLFINLGNYDYGTPPNCADETIHYYNGAIAVD